MKSFRYKTHKSHFALFPEKIFHLWQAVQTQVMNYLKDINMKEHF